MDNKTYFEKQSQLQKIIEELANSQSAVNAEDDIANYVSRLKDIYNGEFRHLYSSTFAVVAGIGMEEEEKLTVLAGNLNTIYEHVFYNDDFDKEFQKNIRKLYDHVNLDLARLNFIRQLELKRKNETEKLRQDIQSAYSELDKVQKKSANMQKDYVAILGIFSAVLLTFIGNIAFSTSVLANIHQSSMYRVAFITVFLGFVVFNLLVYLMNFIKAVMDVDVSLVTDFLEHRKNINCFFIVMLIALVIAWFIDLNVVKIWMHNFNLNDWINSLKNNAHT